MQHWISAEEAAQESGYHIDTVYQFCRDQRFQAEKRGGWWIDRESFLTFLKEQEETDDGRFGPRR